MKNATGDHQEVRVNAAERGEAALRTVSNASIYEKGLDDATVEPLITDLRHYCASKELDFQGCLSMSKVYFNIEFDGED